MFLFFDPFYLVFITPGILLALYATFITKSTFNKYSRVSSKREMTGAEAARDMLRRQGIHDVNIERVSGFLSDHYDPRTRTLRLSENVYSSHSLAAIGVACHEAGHAIQHAHNFLFLGLRSTLVPITNLCSTLWIWVLLIGMFMRFPQFMLAGVIMLAMTVLFALVTLPVEWDASRRAKVAMLETGFLTPSETGQAAKVLNAAFLTYLASAATAILTLLYYLWQLGFLGGNDN